MSTLASSTGLGYYHTLTLSWTPEQKLLPNPGHQYYNRTKNEYDIFSIIIKTYLLNGTTIKQEKSSKAFNILQKQQFHCASGIKMLREIVFQLSPQLGGILEDLQTLVLQFHPVEVRYLPNTWMIRCNK